MIIDFRLKVFQTVALRLSFTQAARELFITQPAVTRHINELEKNIGRPLFNRHGNAISLTTEGELTLAFANKIILAYEQLDEELNRMQDTVSGQLRIGASTTVAQYILPKILAQFKKAYPQIHISLVNDNTSHIESFVQHKKIDIGIIEGNAQNPLLHYEPFVTDEIVLATRMHNNRTKSGTIKITDIPSLPLVVREAGSGTRDVIDKALEKAGIHRGDLNIDLELGGPESMKNYLVHSNSFAFLSIHAILDEMRQHSLRIVEVKNLDVTRHFHFVSLHGQHSQITSRFKNACLLHYK